MKCTKCGKKVDESTKFCSSCGKKVVIENNKSAKKPVPKEFYYIFLGIYLIIIILSIMGILFPSHEQAKCIDSEGRTSDCIQTIDKISDFTFFFRLPLAILSLFAIVYIVAKKLELKALVLPVMNILMYISIVFLYLGGISRIDFLYSILGTGIALFFIWKN